MFQLTRTLLLWALLTAETACMPIEEGHLEVTTSATLWEGAITRADKSSWKPGSKEMFISPTAKNYIPPTFDAALRELNRMLPNSFAEYGAARTSKETCLEGASDEVILLHAFLTDMLTVRWFGPGTKLSAYYARSFGSLSDADPQSLHSKFPELQAAWTLCEYYQWKRDHASVDQTADLRTIFQKHLEILRRTGGGYSIEP
jgi:hypothetical protein